MVTFLGLSEPKPTRKPRRTFREFPGLWIGLCCVAAAIYALSESPRDNVPRFLLVYGMSVTLWLASMWGLRSTSTIWSPRKQVAVLIGLATALRLATALAPTSLSDDVFRYAWDGHLVLEGHNPYRRVPSAVTEITAERAELYHSLNSVDFYSPYPPGAQVMFAFGAGVASWTGIPPDRVLRMMLGLVDIATVFLMIGYLRRRAKPLRWAAWYAWNPFVAWEISGGGHTEALLLFFLMLAVIAATNQRTVLLGAALGVGALMKPTIVLAAPILGWHLLRCRGWLAATGAAALSMAVVALGFAPFWFDELLAHFESAIDLYRGYFIFNAPLYEALRTHFGYVRGVTPDVADKVLDWFDVWLALIVALSALVVDRRVGRLPVGLVLVFVGAVLVTPVFHPWYLLPAVLAAALARSWSVWLLAALVPLTYLAYTVPSQEVPTWVMFAQFIPFALIAPVDVFRLTLPSTLRRRARRKYRAFERYLGRRSRVLDVGAGEGYVGACAARDGHDVTLIDVEDRNRTRLPHDVYDGRRLPFDDASFDVGVLAYVLHHCHDPDQVVAESRRVCRRVVALESVIESPFDRWLLTFLDHLANAFRGIAPERLRFDRTANWRRRFEEAGFRVVEERWLGRFIHKHVLFLLE